MSTVSLKNKLTVIMNSWQLPISPGCEHALKQLIDQGVNKVQVAGWASNPQKIAEVLTNFDKLLTEMTWEAGKQGFTELHEPTLSAALLRICPLFPFC